MKRILRHLLLFLAAAAFLAMTLLWPLSYLYPQSLIVVRDTTDTMYWWHERSLQFHSSRGGLHITWTKAHALLMIFDWVPVPESHVTLWHDPTPAYPHLSDEVAPGHSFLGFSWGFTSGGFIHSSWRNGYQCELIFPYPFLWLLSLILLAWSYRSSRRSRPAPGHCPQCQYDLRASKDRCPECGTPIAPLEQHHAANNRSLPK